MTASKDRILSSGMGRREALQLGLGVLFAPLSTGCAAWFRPSSTATEEIVKDKQGGAGSASPKPTEERQITRGDYLGLEGTATAVAQGTPKVVEKVVVVTATAASKPAEAVAPTATVPAKPTEAPKPTVEPTKPVATATPETNRTATLKGWKSRMVTIDETAPVWDESGEKEGGIPYMDKSGLARTELRINTGAGDWEMVTGGRYEFLGSSVEVGAKAQVQHPDGDEVVTDEGEVLFYRRGDRLVIPGGTDTYLRGNILFILGDGEDNRSVKLIADTSSNFREKRMSGRHNGKSETPSAQTLEVLAAMGKVYAHSMYSGNNCKGKGCRSAVGVYVLRAGDKVTGAEVKVLAAVVLKTEELAKITLKKSI